MVESQWLRATNCTATLVSGDRVFLSKNNQLSAIHYQLIGRLLDIYIQEVKATLKASFLFLRSLSLLFAVPLARNGLTEK
jgi:hypothetical protein